MEEPKPFIEQRALSELGIFLIRKIPGLKKVEKQSFLFYEWGRIAILI